MCRILYVLGGRIDGDTAGRCAHPLVPDRDWLRHDDAHILNLSCCPVKNTSKKSQTVCMFVKPLTVCPMAECIQANTVSIR